MKKPPFRVWIGVMIFFTTFQNDMLKDNMVVSIVAMTAPKNGTNKTTPCNKGQYNASELKYTTAEDVEGKFDWTESDKSLIVIIYYCGYLGTIVLGATLSERIGPCPVIFWASLGCAIVTGFTPLAADYGQARGAIAARFLAGMFGGPVYPAVYVLIAKWAPPKEKGKFLAATMGNTIGTVITWVVVKAFPSKMWRWGFYVLVIIMAVYLTAFFILVSDTPNNSKFVTQEERDYITECQQGHVSSRKVHDPFISILLSTPFWVMVCAQFGNLWSLHVILTVLPKYMKDTLDFDIQSSTGLASLPYLMKFFMSAIFGVVGDWMRQKGFRTLTWQRKFFIIFSHFIPAACLVVIYPAGCASVAVVILIMILHQGFNGAVVVSHLINPQDLSPNFAGTLCGLMNFFCMFIGFFVYMIPSAAILKKYEDDRIKAGGIIFGLGSIALTLGGILFIIFASAEVQPWNEIKEEEPQQPGRQ